MRTLFARVLGVHTDERAFRVGAKGERLVGQQLDRLPRLGVCTRSRCPRPAPTSTIS